MYSSFTKDYRERHIRCRLLTFLKLSTTAIFRNVWTLLKNVLSQSYSRNLLWFNDSITTCDTRDVFQVTKN